MADTRRAVDVAALQRAIRRQQLAAQPPWLHGEVARRMAERLPVVKRSPAVLIDWWSSIGGSAALLRQTYPRARVLRVEPESGIARPQQPWWQALLNRAPVTVAAHDVQPDGAQLVWANMMLHQVSDPGAVIRQWHRALTVDGFLMFSTLGPGTLASLREIYGKAGWGPAHAPFVDMHDLGDMLVEAGFADPVMDQETLRLTWASTQALLPELRGLGANAAPARMPGLRTPRWRARLEQALQARADAGGRIALEFEIVYGHAFKPAPRVRVAAEARLSPEQLQRMARQRSRR